jgi:hypothetical protein
VILVRLLLGITIVIGTACSSPSKPDPTGPSPGPDPGPVVQNAPPVIGTFRVQGSRTGEPPNFADLAESIAVSVTVTDPETAVNDLTFNWSCPIGTFSGSGPAVTWRAPATATATPIDVALTLEVVETYRSQGRSVENRVTGSTTVSLHNSIQEVSDLSRQFLLDFSDSTLGVAQVMRNFEPTCYGTPLETTDVTENRRDFTIIESRIGIPATSVGFGGACAFRRRAGDACSRVPVFWRSRAKQDLYDARGRLVLRRGEVATASGFDQVAAMYYPNQKRWRLCDSSFEPDSTSLDALEIPSLVP